MNGLFVALPLQLVIAGLSRPARVPAGLMPILFDRASAGWQPAGHSSHR